MLVLAWLIPPERHGYSFSSTSSRKGLMSSGGSRFGRSMPLSLGALLQPLVRGGRLTPASRARRAIGTPSSLAAAIAARSSSRASTRACSARWKRSAVSRTRPSRLATRLSLNLRTDRCFLSPPRTSFGSAGLLAWQMREHLAPRLQESSAYERGSVDRASSPSSASFLTTSKLCFSSMTFSIAGIT